MDALDGGAVSVSRVAFGLLALAACWLACTSPAAAAGPIGGTLDLARVSSPAADIQTAPEARGPRGARAYLGDVNGGGLGDIAIGVPSADPGGRTNAGSVYVLFGGGPFEAVNLANLGPRGYRIDGAAPGDRLGTSIARLGYDVGDDGLSDFAMGAPGAGRSALSNAGAVYIVAGRGGQRENIDLDRGESSVITVTGAAADDGAGQSLAAPPRTRTLVIGAPAASPNGLAQAGSAFVLTALPRTVPADRALSIASATGYRLDGRLAAGGAGSAVGWAADFNGDGRGEILVGAPRVAPGANGTFAGEAYVVPAGTTGAVTLGTPPLGGFVIGGEPGMGLGASISRLDDLSGDGLDDVAIGAPTASPGGRFKAGSAVVVLSRRTPAVPFAATAAPGSVIRIDGVDGYDNFGTVVAAAALDSGAANDLVASAPRVDALARKNAGAVYALLGSRIATRPIDLAVLGDSGVRVAGPRTEERSGTELSMHASQRSLAIVGATDTTGVLGLPAPAPAPAAIAVKPRGGCTEHRDIELVVDGSASMVAAGPYVRTAIDALLSKPRHAAINVGAIEIGRRAQQVFAPLTVPAAGLAPGRDLDTLRLLLEENVDAGAGTPSPAAFLAAARLQASALVLITDARIPPASLTPPPGKTVAVLQIGGVRGSAAPRVRVIPVAGAAQLPAALALVEAGLTCEQILKTQVAATGELRNISELTLSRRRRQGAFDTELEPAIDVVTMTFSFKQSPRSARARRSECVSASPVSLQGLAIFEGDSEVARATPGQVQRALNGGRPTFGDGLRLAGRCGRAFLVLEVSGLERLGAAQARAAASSQRRKVRASIKLERPPIRRRIKSVSIGSAKRGRRS